MTTMDVHGQPQQPGRPPNITAGGEGAIRSRTARVPFGALRQKLSYPAREGFHRHWFNDVGNRIQQALEAGYAHVVGKDGKNVSYIGGSHPHGGALTIYAMEIPNEFYQEDQKLKQDIVDSKEAAIRKGNLEPLEGGYVKTAQISSPAAIR